MNKTSKNYTDRIVAKFKKTLNISKKETEMKMVLTFMDGKTLHLRYELRSSKMRNSLVRHYADAFKDNSVKNVRLYKKASALQEMTSKQIKKLFDNIKINFLIPSLCDDLKFIQEKIRGN